MGRLYATLYAKVRAWLIGGSAGAAVAGAVLWAISEASGGPPPEWVIGLVTAGAAQLVGFIAAYMKPETRLGA